MTGPTDLRHRDACDQWHVKTVVNDSGSGVVSRSGRFMGLQDCWHLPCGVDELIRAGVTVLSLVDGTLRHTRVVVFAVLVTGWSGLTFASDVPRTFVDAMKWYRVEAQAGNAEAQFLLGYGYETGTAFGYVSVEPSPFPADPAKARHWYGEAAAQDHDRAKVRLARLLLEARGGPADPDGARSLLEAAAEAGELDAMSLLGFLLLQVEPRDPVGAFLWLSLAARAGDPVASANLANLEEVLDDATRERGAAALAERLDDESR